jgi:predicted MarR family transcription regulator
VSSSARRAAVEDAGDFCWGALAARLLHPVQVEIIEALRWIDRPLAARDLLLVLGRKPTGVRIEHHLRRLTRLDAVALDDSGRARGSVAGRLYRLTRGLR